MKFFQSRALYFFLGLFLAVAIPGVYAWNTAVDPGDPLTADKWNDLVDQVESANVPQGAVMAFNLDSCPSGWRLANGSGTIAGRSVPDLRDEFIRGAGGSYSVGNTQSYAIENIEGDVSFLVSASLNAVSSAQGVFGHSTNINGYLDSSSGGSWEGSRNFDFDASRVVNTANETRPRNVALLFCIKE